MIKINFNLFLAHKYDKTDPDYFLRENCGLSHMIRKNYGGFITIKINDTTIKFQDENEKIRFILKYSDFIV